MVLDCFVRLVGGIVGIDSNLYSLGSCICVWCHVEWQRCQISMVVWHILAFLVVRGTSLVVSEELGTSRWVCLV